jgi:hypothetical protein
MFNFLDSLSLANGWHCEIVPLEHYQTIQSGGEDVVLEVERYKSCLHRMFERMGM